MILNQGNVSRRPMRFTPALLNLNHQDGCSLWECYIPLEPLQSKLGFQSLLFYIVRSTTPRIDKDRATDATLAVFEALTQ